MLYNILMYTSLRPPLDDEPLNQLLQVLPYGEDTTSAIADLP